MENNNDYQSVIGKLEFTPNDPATTKDTGAQWYLEHIMAYDAWDYTSGDPNIIIAVLDGGLDVAHPDIANGTDGYNNMAIGGWNFGNNTSNVTDYNYHGTFVSGIISAKTNNLRGVAGIAGGNGATGSKVLPLKLVNYSATEIDLAVRYAVSQGVKVINMSFWTLQSPTIDVALQYAANNNVFLVKSAGNNQPNYTITYPGTHPEVFAVGATGTNKQRANFSSYGQKLNVVAPGENIYSTGLVSNGEYRYSSGTSFVAPIVSGIAALILSINPDLTAKQVRDIIEQTAQKVGGYTYTNSTIHPNGPWHEQMGYGLVNAYEAVKRAACTTCPYPYISLTGTQPPTPQTYKSVICNEITIQNATVPAGSTLILNACNKTTINPNFKVEAGASFTIR